jgi:hypothetical protein
LGGAVVNVDEPHDLGDQIVATVELPVFEQPSGEDRKEQLD